MTSRLNAALWHQYQGMHIFPVQEYEKTPHVTTPPYTLKWGDVATTDGNRAHIWWTQWPLANIGVAVKPSGLLVVDCDVQKCPRQLTGECKHRQHITSRYAYLHELFGDTVDALGDLVFDQVCQRYGGDWEYVQSTYRVATGSGGQHYYFKWPEGVQASQASLVNGILDVRCNGGTRGGYVLGAGSETHAGPYTAVVYGAPILPAPDWLVQLCTEKPRTEWATNADEYMRPAIANYTGLQDAVLYAPPGNRNNCLHWAALCMVSDGASEQECQDVLGESAKSAGLTDVETRDTIRSAYQRRR